MKIRVKFPVTNPIRSTSSISQFIQFLSPKNEGKKRTLLLHFFHMNLVFLLEKNSFTWGLAMGQTPATDNKKTCDTGEGFCPPQPNLHWAILFSTRKKGKFPSILIKVSPSLVEIQMCFLPFSPEFPTNFPISGEKGGPSFCLNEIFLCARLRWPTWGGLIEFWMLDLVFFPI